MFLLIFAPPCSPFSDVMSHRNDPNFTTQSLDRRHRGKQPSSVLIKNLRAKSASGSISSVRSVMNSSLLHDALLFLKLWYHLLNVLNGLRGAIISANVAHFACTFILHTFVRSGILRRVMSISE